MARPLAALPKAHLHLHFTGAMRHPTLVELAHERRIHLPEALAGQLDERGVPHGAGEVQVQVRLGECGERPWHPADGSTSPARAACASG